MPIALGITGGIGSGKSTLCKVFSILGIPVFEADIVAKELLNFNTNIKKELKALFGSEVYISENQLNRQKLAEYIFGNDDLREKVNQIVHPKVREAFNTWKAEQNTTYIIHEAAILFESGFYKMMDYTILVTAPEEMRIERVVDRDKISAEQVKARMEKQWSDAEKRKLATLELVNDNKNALIPQIIEIDKRLKEYGKIW